MRRANVGFKARHSPNPRPHSPAARTLDLHRVGRNEKVKSCTLTNAGRTQLLITVANWAKATTLVTRFLEASLSLRRAVDRLLALMRKWRLFTCIDHATDDRQIHHVSNNRDSSYR
jgi:hypothetical protein